jgi:hypothetical protein
MMPPGEHLPRAMFGGLLWGDAAVRYVFIDEAGTSAEEPVTVVVGLIIDADKQLMLAEAAVSEVLGAVPKQFRTEDFEFHALEIWNSPKYREHWLMSDRLGLLRRMMALPRRLRIPITMCMARRDAEGDFPIPEGMTRAQVQHVMAFGNVITHSDKYIRDHAEPNEVATVVAEDVPEMRRHLQRLPKFFRDNPFRPSAVRPTLEEIRLGYTVQETDVRVSRIRSSVHFVQKGDDPLIQLADACAFGFRRYFSNQKFGEDFVMSILGDLPPQEDFAGPISVRTWLP